MIKATRIVRYTTGLCLAGFSIAAPAQPGERNFLGVGKAPITDSIPADRPGFGDNTAVVPTGHFVLEAGYQYDDNADDSETHAAPNLLLRSGVSENLEVRLGFEGYLFNSPGRDGTGNTNIGLKIDALDEGRWTPELAIIPQLSLPTGDDDVAVDKSEPEVRFAWSKGLTANTGIAGNVNLAERVDINGNRNLETAASISGGFSLSDQLGSYVEYYTILPEANGSDDSHVVNGGMAYLVSNTTQLDAFVGTGLNDTASDLFVGFGIAHLW